MIRKNMYDCTDCPKCQSRFRWASGPQNPKHPRSVICDDCGLVEPCIYDEDARVYVVDQTRVGGVRKETEKKND